MTAQKGLVPIIILLGILILVGVAGGAYYLGYSGKSEPTKVVSQLQPTSQPTSVQQATTSADISNWKTYNDDRYNFTFQYPENLTTEKGVLPQKITVYGSPREGVKEIAYFSVLITPINQFKQDDIKNFAPFDFKNIQKDDQTFTILTYSAQYGGAPSLETQNWAKDIFNQILSTFKFTQ